MRSSWTDSRLDDLNGRVSTLSAQVSDLDARITGRIDGLQHTMVQAFIGLMIAMVTGFAALATLIVTKV